MTKIEWANPPGYRGEGWPIVTGCKPVSPGCANCWGARQASGRLRHHRCYKGLVHDGKWTGEVRANSHLIGIPLHWRAPRCVFVCSSSDLFHPDVPFGFIDKVFAVMALCPQHRFLVLTKRPERMAEYFLDPYRFSLWHNARGDVLPCETAEQADAADAVWPSTPNEPNKLLNVALGTSIEDQPRDYRVPTLQQCPAAMRFISVEPMLGPVDLREHIMGYVDDDVTGGRHVKLPHTTPYIHQEQRIAWVIIGCESGPKRRPCKSQWVYDLLGQCAAAGVPAFVKQMDIDGCVSHNPAEWRVRACVRQWPTQFFQEQADERKA